MSTKTQVRPARTNEREAQREATQSRILDAAIPLFAQRGFSGASVSDVARACGAPVPLIMYHFKSNQGVWEAAVERLYARVNAKLQDEMAALEGLSGLPFYKAAIRAHIATLAAYPEHMRLLLQEGAERTPRLEWLIAHHQKPLNDLIISLISAAQGEGLIAQGDPEHLKFVLSGAFSLPIVLAPEYEILTGKNPIEPSQIEAHIDACLELILKA
jgi:TetR/AcrR family transcriptional regulator